MAYCSTTEVAAEFKALTFSASTEVTSTECTRFIDEASDLIDAYIASRYAVPVTGGSKALNVLKMVAIGLVACRVQDILEVRTGTPKTDQDLKRPDICKNAMPMLKAIQSGAITLLDATLASSTDGVRSYNSENDVEPYFDRDCVQW